jgi:hypothetical protein
MTDMRQAIRELIGGYEIITPGSIFYKDYAVQCKKLKI